MAAPTSNVYNEYFSGSYISKNSSWIRDEYKFLFETYGKGLKAIDFLEAFRDPIYLPSNTLKAILTQSPVPVIKTGSAVTEVAAGASISFTIHADSLDANSKPTIRKYDTFSIPASYFASTTLDKEYIVTDITGTTLTAYPLDVTADLASTIASGTELMIVATAFARGTLGTTPKMESYSTRDYKARLIKEALGVEGSALAMETELHKIGDSGLMLSNLLLQAEFRLDVQKNNVITMGEDITQTNDAVDAVSTEFGGTNAILGTQGLFPAADEHSMAYNYTDALAVADFDAIDMLLESRGVTSKTLTMWAGSQVRRDLENSGLTWIREYSGGSDLLDKVKGKLGVVIERIVKSGREYKILNPMSLNNPAAFAMQASGVYQYKHPTSALIIPDENVTMREFNGKKNASIPNVTIGYVRNNGEDRSNVLDWEKGVTNVVPGNASSSMDGLKAHWLCEMFMIIGGAEKWVYAYK